MSGTRQSGSRKGIASAKKNTSRKNSDRAPAAETGNGLGDEVRLVVLLIVAAFLLISNFGIGGAVGRLASRFMFGCLGIFAYIFPAVLLIVILFLLVNRDNPAAVMKVAGVSVGCVALTALLHMFTVSEGAAEGFLEIFLYCAENRTGGGLTGGLLSGLLMRCFGLIGAYLVLVGVLIICAVVVTEKSFVKGVSKGSKKVYESAREDIRRRKRTAGEKTEQKEQRVRRRASGVTMDVTIPRQKDAGLIELTAGQVSDPVSPTLFPEDLFEEESEPEAVSEPLPARQSEDDISFNEEDLLKNALSKRELEEEKAAARRKEAHIKEEPVPESVKEPDKESVIEDTDMDSDRKEMPGMPLKQYRFPSVKLLKAPKGGSGKKGSSTFLQETARHLQQVMEDFGVNATVVNASQGPAVTRFEVQPAHGVKVNKIVALADDIKLNLAVPDIRMEAPIPGKAAVGIEVPNKENSVVMLRELFESKEFKEHPSKIAFAVGKDIGGNIMVTDIAKMPHLLIAGATGSGKSVCINTLIMSILYKARPDEVKLIMIDPKVVELSVYNGIPHLLIPVVTDPKKAAGALNWAVAEMMDRYNKFAETNVRNVEGYNSKIDASGPGTEESRQKMPQIVIIVDELADLMMVASGEVEDAICRLAQLARAAGIHLIIATQRPSVNVITGLIKANMPSRIAFAVSSGVDSRTILDMVGAEKLLGKGDMLFSPYGVPKPMRVQGAFVSDSEVSAVVEFLSSQNSGSSETEEQMAERMKQVQAAVESASIPDTSGGGNDQDVLFADAGRFIIEKDKASIGMLQRWFKVGFNRAARIMDQLAEAGVVGEEEGTKPRKVLMSMEEFEALLEKRG